MKQYFIYWLLVLLSLGAKAQYTGYLPMLEMGKSWQVVTANFEYTDCLQGPQFIQNDRYRADTLVFWGGKEYYLLRTDRGTQIHLREDTLSRKLYQVVREDDIVFGDSVERLLFDYTLQVGDSIKLWNFCVTDPGGCLSSITPASRKPCRLPGSCIVVLIDTVEVHGVWRRRIGYTAVRTIPSPSCPPVIDTVFWTEGIGPDLGFHLTMGLPPHQRSEIVFPDLYPFIPIQIGSENPQPFYNTYDFISCVLDSSANLLYDQTVPDSFTCDTVLTFFDLEYIGLEPQAPDYKQCPFRLAGNQLIHSGEALPTDQIIVYGFDVLGKERFTLKIPFQSTISLPMSIPGFEVLSIRDGATQLCTFKRFN